jgi:hypothetical protein
MRIFYFTEITIKEIIVFTTNIELVKDLTLIKFSLKYLFSRVYNSCPIIYKIIFILLAKLLIKRIMEGETKSWYNSNL